MLAIFTWFQKIGNKKPIVIKEDMRKKFVKSSAYLLVIFYLHTIAMNQLEGLSIGDAAWLTWTTITTVGYGDIPIKSPLSRLSTILLLYLGGIFVLAKTAGDYFDYRAIKHQKQLKGEWRWNMKHHIVIISDHDDHISNLYYERLVAEFQQVPKYKDCAIQILTNDFPKGLPESLQLLGVIHYEGKGNVPENLGAVNIDSADFIIILAKMHNDPLSDGNTFDILHRIRDCNQTASILVECVDDVNRERLEQAGANIVADSTCTGSMFFRKRVSMSGIIGNPIDALAERYLYNLPCPFMTDLPKRLNRVIRIARDYGVQGLVYYNLKYCDIWRAEFKFIKDALYKELSVPSLLIETDYSPTDVGTIRTKVEAFLEMIGGQV